MFFGFFSLLNHGTGIRRNLTAAEEVHRQQLSYVVICGQVLLKSRQAADIMQVASDFCKVLTIVLICCSSQLPG